MQGGTAMNVEYVMTKTQSVAVVCENLMFTIKNIVSYGVLIKIHFYFILLSQT